MGEATIEQPEESCMDRDSIEDAVIGGKVSRRWLLRSTAGLTAGLVGVGRVNIATAEPTPEAGGVAPDHDPATGEIFDRVRHHHWDTV
jgi:hypothetical protein